MERILVVDDNKMNLHFVQMVLRDDYEIELASSGKEALEYLSHHQVNLILLDYKMPEMDGLETMKLIRCIPTAANTPIVVMTAVTDTDVEKECLNEGAMDFITKPFVIEIMKSRIARIIELEGYQNSLEKKLAAKTREVEKVTLQAITMVANAIDAKDEYTKNHSARVAEYAKAIVKRMGWKDEDVQNLYQIALLHDIGKIGVPDAVLNKPGRLDDEEFKIIKSHTVIGAHILKDIKMIPGLDLGAHYHHERWDGRGYPQGLEGEQIPLVARVIGVADAYDAMTSNRVYRKHLDAETVRNELEKGKGTQFDPNVVTVFMELLDNHELPQLGGDGECD